MKKYLNIIFAIVIVAFVVALHLHSKRADERALKKLHAEKNEKISEIISDDFTNNPGAEMYEVLLDNETLYFYPVKKENIDSLSGVFTAEAKAMYCCMWSNKQPVPVSLTYDFKVIEE